MPAAAFRVFLQGPRESPVQDLAHHRVIVAGAIAVRIRRCRPLDVEPAIVRLHEAVGAGHDHRARRVGAADMRIVIHLDPARRRVEAEQLRHPGQQVAVGRGLGEAPAEGVAGVGAGMIDQFPLGAALGHGDRDLAFGAHPQRLGDQIDLRGLVAQEDRRRGRLVLVKLPEERAEHVFQRHRFVVAREIGAVAIVAPGPEEEDLDAGAPALLFGGDDIGVADIQILDVDVLVGLDLGHRPHPVAEPCGGLELGAFRGVLHRGHQLVLHLARTAGQEIARLADQRRVILRAHMADAGGGTALELILQAGSGAAGEDRIGTAAQKEGALQGVQGPVHRAGRREGPEILPRQGPCAAIFDHPGPFLRVGTGPALAPGLEGLACLAGVWVRPRLGGLPVHMPGDQDVGKALVVAQQHIVARRQPLDHVGFEE